MDLSEIDFISRFGEALSKVDFDVLIEQILKFEESFEVEKITDTTTKSQATGQKRQSKLKMVDKMTRVKDTNSGSTWKQQDDSEPDVEVLYEEHSKSCQTNLFIDGTLVEEWPETIMESESSFKRYEEVSKGYKRNRAKFKKKTTESGLPEFIVNTMSGKSTIQSTVVPEIEKSFSTYYETVGADGNNANASLIDHGQSVPEEDKENDSLNANSKININYYIGLEEIEAPAADNDDDVLISTLPRLSIPCNEPDVDNQDNTLQQAYKQLSCEQTPEFSAIKYTEDITNADVVTNSTYMSDTSIESCRRKEATDVIVTDFNVCYDKMANPDKAKEGNEIKYEHIQNPVKSALEEATNKSSFAMKTRNMRDIAFPDALCSILYEELLQQDRTKLENLAITLEQAQEKFFTMAPRTLEERQVLLETQRLARLERNLKGQDENRDDLKKVSFDIMIRFLEIMIVATVKFAKCIPGFTTLDIGDQITLIKDANLANIRPHFCRCVNSETQLVTCLPGLHIGFEEICDVFTENMRDQMILCESKGNQLNITAREEALLQAIILMSAVICFR